MSRTRTSLLLLGICVLAVIIGALRLVTEPAPQPTGSSYSYQFDGTLALYTWFQELGAQPQRLRDTTIDPNISTLLVIEPGSLVDSPARQAFDAVADRGGTIVLAGDSVQFVVYARALGVTVASPGPSSGGVTTPDGLALPITGRFSVHADGAEPLLMRPNGDWLALKMPYRNGNLVVIATPTPLTNVGLSDDATARFVFRDVVSVAQNQPVAFDEIDRALVPDAPGPPSVNSLLLQTAPGRAVLYVALLIFVFLLLGGRRLGPALAVRSAAESQRTMYEHVQMLADLYRRAGQFNVVRAAFGRHYARVLTRGGVSANYAEALRQVEGARTDSELVAAVSAIDDAR